MAISNKYVLITGATKRLGLAFTKKSLSMGLSVIAHYRTSAAPLKKWLSQNSDLKKHVHYIQADLTTDLDNILESISAHKKNIIGLINNASIFTKGDLSSNNHYQKTHTINVTVPSLISQHFYRIVKSGWIINITDANLKHNNSFQNYRISKKMLTEMTMQQAFLMAPKIRVNAIAPGAILPSMTDDKDYFNSLKEKAPLKRTGDLLSIQQTYEFLIQNKSITGQVIYVDNGIHLL